MVNVEQVNRQLKREKGNLENDLQAESNKRIRTEEELDATRALRRKRAGAQIRKSTLRNSSHLFEIS